ncbi:MAG: hydantoinase/oxoprolinase family protein, partial [Actinobacteria bacterium]|nr:hydantoinase/oxoprolinase family protein [Actinomycetota bacterium]
YEDLLSFDMGGTTAKFAVIVRGEPLLAHGFEVDRRYRFKKGSGLPINLPVIEMIEIGAGGGSIARIDALGLLKVGPDSAGADPGPACYGRGGEEPTVTDADLVLGRIPAGAAFPGLGGLDVDAARAALDRARVDAGGVVAVVDAGMEQALRQVSVARGVDPRELALVAFGGAGPLHACALAEALGMPTVIVPPRAGVLSAVGLLCSPVQHDVVRSWSTPRDHAGLDAALSEMADQARAELSGQLASLGDVERPETPPEVEVATSLDCRYAGQSHELTVPAVAGFAAEHRRRNGFDRPDAPIEVVALRARATRPAPLEVTDLPAPPERQAVVGPTVVSEPDCTVWVPRGWRADPGPVGALLLTRTSG